MNVTTHSRCVIDLALLSIAEYLEMPRDDDVVSQLQDMCAVSQLNFLEIMEDEVIVLPSDWRADILSELLILPTYDYKSEESTPSEPVWEGVDVKKLVDDILEITDTISGHYEVIEVPFGHQAAVEYAELISLLPSDVTSDIDIDSYKLTCKYAALAHSLELPFKTNNFLFHDTVTGVDAEEYAWVELVFDVYEGQK